MIYLAKFSSKEFRDLDIEINAWIREHDWIDIISTNLTTDALSGNTMWHHCLIFYKVIKRS